MSPIQVKTRTMNPSYDVWRQNDDGSWRRIAEAVAAGNRRDAIKAAADQLIPDDDRYGTFATTRPGQFEQQTRNKRVETTDVWG
jgi:hypothetical protein